MPYKCIVSTAMPCVKIEKYNTVDGSELAKPKKHYKFCRIGDVVDWVDECSRKHFEPTDKETEKRDREDFKRLKAELEELGYEVAKGAKVWELAKELNRIKKEETAPISKPVIIKKSDKKAEKKK